MSGFSGNCLNSEALQGLSSLLVGVNPGAASSASSSWDSSNREKSGLGHPGPGVHLPWSSPAVGNYVLLQFVHSYNIYFIFYFFPRYN